MSVLMLTYVLQEAAADNGLTLGEMLSDIPHDGAAIFVYILITMALVFVIRAGRKKSPDHE